MKTDIIDTYMQKVQKIYGSGVTTEHSYRGALEYLFNNITDDVQGINEPKAVRDVGRPDFVFKRSVGHNQITVGHCEAKDIDKDVTKRGLKDYSKEQFSRYIKGLPNLIYTNGLDFLFYVKGELVREISIGDFMLGINPKADQYPVLAAQLTEFAQERLQTITSSKRLAELMAGKALMIKEALFQTLKQDPDLTTELAGQYKAFRDQLIHDLKPEGFADIYAETVAYGLFAARLHDDTLEDFSRQEALELLPKSNPFLRDLFGYVAGPRLDERIRRDIDELAEIFQATDLQKLFKDFGSFTKRNDPFIHFYETFLAEYNPKKRKARGVWYTPEPVVNFIVRAVDDVLKSEFGLPMGLADTSKITVDVDTGQTKTVRGKAKPIIEKREMHRVQILDPATGTGTFLAEVIKQIAPKVKDIAPGKWSRYVEQDLIPRIHGFELLMASYAMCHMKLDMMLSEMDYVPTSEAPRLSVYLTNSLEEGDKEVRDLFMAQWLSNEAKAANEVKRDKPIMCIIGNPPYSVSSSNRGKWIENLISIYKANLNEQNISPLSDDYIKFIRYSHHMIEKNGEGVLAFITNNSFLDGLIHRQMREELLKSFDKIYLVDLHGNSKKKEVSPDGSVDKNIFDIQQGVSILVAVKTTSNTKHLATIKHIDLWGTRESKNSKLYEQKLSSSFKKFTPTPPFNFFVPKNFKHKKKYDEGFSLVSLFKLSGSGIKFRKDKLLVKPHFDKTSALRMTNEMVSMPAGEILSKYDISETKDWKVEDQRQYFTGVSLENILAVSYRPFDLRYCYYNYSVINKIIPRGDSRRKLMRHMSKGQNLGLCLNRQIEVKRLFADAFVTNKMFDLHGLSMKEGNYFLPLYLYPDESELDQTRRVNMDPKIRKAIEKAATDKTRGTPDEVAIFDYIYGVLHCPAYRETYAEFLKIDFPRVPYPSSPESFWDISEKGSQLRRLHLMESDVIGETPYPFMGESEEEDGRDMIIKPSFTPVNDVTGHVHISPSQYFEGVPLIAWEFYIGGYQPAQKWLKDRKGRELSWDDMQHYQKIIKILTETDRIMKTIKMDLG